MKVYLGDDNMILELKEIVQNPYELALFLFENEEYFNFLQEDTGREYIGTKENPYKVEISVEIMDSIEEGEDGFEWKTLIYDVNGIKHRMWTVKSL